MSLTIETSHAIYNGPYHNAPPHTCYRDRVHYYSMCMMVVSNGEPLLLQQDMAIVYSVRCMDMVSVFFFHFVINEFLSELDDQVSHGLVLAQFEPCVLCLFFVFNSLSVQTWSKR